MNLTDVELSAAMAPLPTFWEVKHFGDGSILTTRMSPGIVNNRVIKSIIAYTRVSNMRKEAELMLLDILKYEKPGIPMTVRIEEWLQEYGGLE